MGKVSTALRRQHPTWKRAVGTRRLGFTIVSLTSMLPLFPTNDSGQCFTKVYEQVLLLSPLDGRGFERPVHTRQGPVHICPQNSNCHLPSAEGQAGPWASPNCGEFRLSMEGDSKEGALPASQLSNIPSLKILPPSRWGQREPLSIHLWARNEGGKARVLSAGGREGGYGFNPCAVRGTVSAQWIPLRTRSGIHSLLHPHSHAHTHIETALGQFCMAVMGCKEHRLICFSEEPPLGNR